VGRYDWERKGNLHDRPIGWSGFAGKAVFVTAAIAICLMAYTLMFATGTDQSAKSADATEGELAGPLSEPNLIQQPKAGSGSVPPTEANSSNPSMSPKIFAKCGLRRITCVVDGDTFWMDGEKIRIADIDTPEISRPLCPEERELGLQATDRLISLLNEGPFELQASDRDRDGFGRKLRVVVRDGRSLGQQLVEEGLAHRWNGAKEPWCI